RSVVIVGGRRPEPPSGSAAAASMLPLVLPSAAVRRPPARARLRLQIRLHEAPPHLGATRAQGALEGVDRLADLVRGHAARDPQLARDQHLARSLLDRDEPQQLLELRVLLDD